MSKAMKAMKKAMKAAKKAAAPAPVKAKNKGMLYGLRVSYVVYGLSETRW